MQLCMQMAPTGHTQEPRLSGPLARAVRLHSRGRGKRRKGKKLNAFICKTLIKLYKTARREKEEE